MATLSWIITGQNAFQVVNGTLSGTGLMHLTAGVIDSAAWPFEVGPSVDQLIVTNHAGTDVAAITAAGDLGYASGSFTVSGFQGRPAASTAPSNLYVWAWNNGAGQWQPTNPNSLGITSFTPGSDLLGNGTSTASNQYVSSLSYSSAAAGGTIAINGTGTAFQVAAGNTGFVFSQATQTSTTAPANFTLKPQFQAGVDKGSSAANTPGSLIVNYGTPYTTTNAGKEAAFVVQRNGAFTASLQGWTGGPTTYGALYLGPSITPSNTNYTILSDGTANTYFNSPGTSGQVHFQINNSDRFEMTTTYFAAASDNVFANGNSAARWNYVAAASTGFLVYHAQNDANTVAQLGDSGGNGYLSLGDNAPHVSRLVYPTGGSGNLTLDNGSNGNAVFNVGGTSGNQVSVASATPTVSVTGTGATNGANITFQSQAGASTFQAGSVIVNPPAPTGGGLNGLLIVESGGSGRAWLGSYGYVSGGADTYGALWLWNTPSTSNFVLAANASILDINHPTEIAFDINGAGQWAILSNVTEPFNTNTHKLGQNGNSWSQVSAYQYGIDSSSSSAALGFNSANSGLTGYNLTVSAQNSSGAAGTNTGGTLYLLSGGVNAGTGLNGNVVLGVGTNSYVWTPTSNGAVEVVDGNGLQAVIANYGAVSGGSTIYSALWLGQGTTAWTPATTNYTLVNQSGGLYINAPSGGMHFAIGGAIYLSLSTTALTFAPVAVNPSILQGQSLGDVAANNLTIQAQAASSGATGLHQNAGSLLLDSGTPVAGYSSQVKIGGTNSTTTWLGALGTWAYALGGAGNGMGFQSTAVSVSNANVTLTAAQATSPYIKVIGTLSASINITFPTGSTGQAWIVDTVGVTFSTYTIRLVINSTTMATALSSGAIWMVVFNGTKLYAVNIALV